MSSRWSFTLGVAALVALAHSVVDLHLSRKLRPARVTDELPPAMSGPFTQERWQPGPRRGRGTFERRACLVDVVSAQSPRPSFLRLTLASGETLRVPFEQLFATLRHDPVLASKATQRGYQRGRGLERTQAQTFAEVCVDALSVLVDGCQVPSPPRNARERSATSTSLYSERSLSGCPGRPLRLWSLEPEPQRKSWWPERNTNHRMFLALSAVLALVLAALRSELPPRGAASPSSERALAVAAGAGSFLFSVLVLRVLAAWLPLATSASTLAVSVVLFVVSSAIASVAWQRRALTTAKGARPQRAHTTGLLAFGLCAALCAWLLARSHEPMNEAPEAQKPRTSQLVPEAPREPENTESDPFAD